MYTTEYISRSQSEADILRMIPIYITRTFGPNVTHVYNKYITDEQFDELELIMDDFKEEDWRADDCQITTFITEALHWNTSQKHHFWQYMRDFLGIQPIPKKSSTHKPYTSSNNTNTNNNPTNINYNSRNVSENSRKPQNSRKTQKLFPSPMNVDWNLGTNKTHLLTLAKQQLNQQCFNKLHTHDIQSLINIYAIGIKNNIQSLLVLLYDIYTRYRIRVKLSQHSSDQGFIGATIDPTQFVKHCKFLQNHMKHIPHTYEDIIQCLTHFEARFLPRLYIVRMKVIDDNCNHFIEYSLMVGQILNELLYVENDSELPTTPMEVNLIIIPKKVKSGIIDFSLSSDDSSDEDIFQFGDDDGCSDDSKNDSCSTTYVHTIGKLLKSKNIRYVSDVVCVGSKSDFVQSKKRLKKMFLKYLCEGKNVQNSNTNVQNFRKGTRIESHQRISIVIDRRVNNNELYIYQLPELMYNHIPNDYSIENLIFSCAHYIIPDVECGGGSGGGRYIGGKYSSDEMFLLSYECLDVHLNRLQFFWTGGGMRLEPGLLGKIWPNCFLDMSVDGKYSEEYLVENFGLDCVDRNFENWYDIFCG